MKLSVVIPCYNEKETIADILDAVRASPVIAASQQRAKDLNPRGSNKLSEITEVEILVVDDYSTDGTRDLLQGRAFFEN